MEAGKRGISSTQIMWSATPCRTATPMAADTARAAPSEPSLATRIFSNIGGLLGFALVVRERLRRWHEPLLSDERRHHGAADHGRDEDRILLLIDDLVGETEQRRDRA